MAGFISKMFSGDKGGSRRQELYGAAFEQAAVGIALVGRDGQWVHVNDRLVRLLGYQREELLITSLRELTHPDDRKLEAPYVRRLASGEVDSYALDKRLLHKSKKYVTLRVVATRCRKANGEFDFYEYVVIPLPEEAEPTSADDPLEIALEHVEDIGVIRMAPDGVITGWSKGAEKIFGLKASEAVRKPRSILYRDADAFEQKPQADLQHALTQGMFDEESWRVSKDGFALWTHTTLVARRRRGEVVDVVEIVRQPSHNKGNPAHDALRQRTEQLLAESKAALSRLQDESEQKVAEAVAARDKLKKEAEQQMAGARAAYMRLRRESETIIETLNRRVRDTQEELHKARGVEQSLRDAIVEVTSASEATFAELKTMTEALRLEIRRRRELEESLSSAQEEIASGRARVDGAAVAEATQPASEQIIPEALPERGDPTCFASHLFRIAAERRTGTMVVRHEGNEKRILLEKGQLVACVSNQPRTPIGETLIERGIITAEERDRALDIQQHTDIAFGRVLHILGYVTDEQLMELMSERSMFEAEEIVSWPEVDYFFVESDIPVQKYFPLRSDVQTFFGSLLVTLPEAITPIAVAEPEPEPAATMLSAITQDLPAFLTERSSLDAEPATPEFSFEPTSALPSSEEIVVQEMIGGAPFIGSGTRKSKKYHLPTCRSVARLAAEKRLPLPSKEEAEKLGYAPCSLCLGKQPTVSRKKRAK